MIKEVKYNILIVDDDKFLLDMYTLKFSQSGFSVDSSLGAVDALNKLKDGESPDIILTDVLMPTMDGFEFLRNIKEARLAKNAVIIILSNKGEKADVDRGVSLGASGYIIKASAIPSEVVQKVREIVEN